MDVLLGNDVSIRILVKDQTRVALTTLATCTEIRFMVKTAKTDLDAAALISKVLVDGITVDIPSTGYVKVPLTAADTGALAVGSYFMGLQLEWAGPVIQEVVMSDDTFNILQDTIRG